MASGTNKRSPDFSDIELQTLLKEVEKNKSSIFQIFIQDIKQSQKTCLGIHMCQGEFLKFHWTC